MRLINVKAFLEREVLIRKRKRVDRRARVFEFCDDETTNYAILSHRWVGQEVDYAELAELIKMGGEERDEIRQRGGYQKILRSCEQAKMDGHEWLWVDTCCLDKRSSAELSEAINSMYRWYENSRVCYAYLHDVCDSSFPTESDKSRYPNFNGWPEWFSRGWTLQEMIAPNNVQFFNKDWRPLGDKRTFAPTLADITRVPQHILRDGLSYNRPCIAQIMSWAADRTTTRVEDRAYSLMGLLNVNMPMLYGEGSKAFHRLQLEIIRMSNDQSIFAWGCDGRNGRTGSALADDPSFFQGCNEMELMDLDEFIQSCKGEALPSIEDRFGVFHITNRGIQICLFLHPCVDSDSVFEALLPCRYGPSGPPVAINLALWKSNYYRYSMALCAGVPTKGTLQFRQLFLSYQDTSHHNVIFEIDDRAITENGFIECGTYPSNLAGNTVALTSTNPLCVKVYSDNQTNSRFAAGFGKCFGKEWIHFTYENPASANNGRSWQAYATEEYQKMSVRGLEYPLSMAWARSRSGSYGHVWINHFYFPQSTSTVRTSCVMWERSRNFGVKIEVFRCPGFRKGLNEWTNFRVDRASLSNHDMRGLMLDYSWGRRYGLLVDGVFTEFSLASIEIKLGDYGHFLDSKDFCCEGNVFADFGPLFSKADLIPRQQYIKGKHGYNTDGDYLTIHPHINDVPVSGTPVALYKPLGLSLPNNHDFSSYLVSLSSRLANRYLITRVIQCPTARLYASSTLDNDGSSIATPLCTIAKPLAWYRDESFGSVLGKRTDDE